MKPEAGQWWFPVMRNKLSRTRDCGVFIVGTSSSGRIVVEFDGTFEEWDNLLDYEHEPRCTGWDWVVPEPAEEPQPVVHYDPIADRPRLVLRPQKKQIRQKTPVPDECDTAVSVTRDFSPEIGIAARTEDPDEWVIQDRVPPRAGIDQVRWGDGSWRTVDGRWEVLHGENDPLEDGITINVRCRRRDLPKVEQCEPNTSDPACPDCGAVDCERAKSSSRECSSGFEPGQRKVCGRCGRMNCESLTQPQKTRVRLWISGDDGRVYAAYDPCEPDDCDDEEIHHDSEGFYVEGGQS